MLELVGGLKKGWGPLVNGICKVLHTSVILSPMSVHLVVMTVALCHFNSTLQD